MSMDLDAVVDFERPEWHRYAACRGVDPDLFFPQAGAPGSGQGAAKSYCANCPVRQACEDAGAGEHHGIWGGKSERARDRDRYARRHGEAARSAYRW